MAGRLQEVRVAGPILGPGPNGPWGIGKHALPDQSGCRGRRVGVVALGLLAALTSACSAEQNPTRELGEPKLVEDRGEILWNAATMDRLGVRMPGAATNGAGSAGMSSMESGSVPPAVDPDAESPIVWRTPDGWTEQPPTSMRLANFHAGNPSVECYVTILGGDGGGMLANVNRWRDQLALAPIGDAELDALQRVRILDEDAVLVDLDSGDGRGLLGTVSVHRGSAVFVKMVGPSELIAQERERFLSLCASIAFRG